MARILKNWIESYVEYASVSEAPRIFHFWAGVSAVAGTLRRKVWFDQIKFVWYPSFYVVFVAPPGVATKSVTADGSMDLLRAVPGIKFGPDEVTWQQLVVAFAAACEEFELEGEFHPMSPLTILSSEFGMMMDFKDSKLVNLFITLWDGRKQFEKQTKMSGNETINAPWINLLACTTPQWISSNMDANTVGGGFTSRCIFVYAEKKERPIAYVEDAVTFDYGELQQALIHDLEHISVALAGRYRLSDDAKRWGIRWYEKIWNEQYQPGNEDFMNNYLARKQAHLHKTAMVLAAAKRDELVLTLEDLQLADIMLQQTEENYRKVFQRIGRSDEAAAAARIAEEVERKGEVTLKELVRLSQIHFPNAKDFDGILESFLKGGQMILVQVQDEVKIKWVG